MWLDSHGELRLRTREAYDWALRVHLSPRFGSRRIATLTEEGVALLIADMRRRGYKPWTVRAVLTPLGRVFGYAARRGLIGGNPMERLKRGERPSVGRREMRILSRDEIGKLLSAR